MAKQPTTEQLASALKVFILSGSADGREDMRATCKKLVLLFAYGPKLFQIVKEYADDADCGNGGEHTEETGDKRDNCWHCSAVKLIAEIEAKRKVL